MAYNIIKLKNMYNAIGENETKNILNGFSCPLNEDVEFFLKQKAIEFLKMDVSQTFLVSTDFKKGNVIVGYFAITSKTTTVNKKVLSKSLAKRLSRFAARPSEIDRNVLVMSLPLIGQLGKNYTNGYNTLISGDELLKIACKKVKEATDILGGRFVFIECEDNINLKEFYESNGFVCFGKRLIEEDEKTSNNSKYLLQMLLDLKNIN